MTCPGTNLGIATYVDHGEIVRRRMLAGEFSHGVGRAGTAADDVSSGRESFNQCAAQSTAYAGHYDPPGSVFFHFTCGVLLHSPIALWKRNPGLRAANGRQFSGQWSENI